MCPSRSARIRPPENSQSAAYLSWPLCPTVQFRVTSGWMVMLALVFSVVVEVGGKEVVELVVVVEEMPLLFESGVSF